MTRSEFGRRDAGSADRASGVRSDDFDDQVRDALAHLYNLAYLQTHPLAALIRSDRERTAADRGRRLRQHLTEAIESLGSGARPGVGASPERGYQELRLRYLEGLDPTAVQDRLGIGKSQYYRDLDRALDAVVSLVRERLGAADDLVYLSERRETRWDRSGRAMPAGSGALAFVSEVPVPSTSFVGREGEIAEVIRLFESSRLLTLTGPAGAGKTRLSVEVGRALAKAFDHGCCFVPLASVEESSRVALAILQTLGIPSVSDLRPLTTLKKVLRAKCLLLILDNFEHLLDASSVVTELLGGCPELKILVTSRAALRVRGEQRMVVRPLAFPDPGRSEPVEQLSRYPSVSLFLDRARASRSDFSLTRQNSPAVAGICGRVDGLPLSIELAAAHCDVLSPREILGELTRSRLDLLSEGAVDLPSRQRTLRAALDWSFALLGAEEQRWFAYLGVFVGSFTREAAELVASTTPTPRSAPDPALGTLVRRSLVQVERTANGISRFRLLETIRDYARLKLAERGDLATAQRSHAAYYLDWTDEAEPKLWGGPQQAAWIADLERERGNLQAALEWCLANDAPLGLRLATNLGRFWAVRGPFASGREWLERFLARVPESMGKRWQALFALGDLAWRQGDPVTSATRLDESRAAAEREGDQRGIVVAQAERTFVAALLGDYRGAAELWETQLAAARRIGDPWALCLTLAAAGFVARAMGDVERAPELVGEGLTIIRKIGDTQLGAVANWILGSVLLARGDPRQAEEAFQEALLDSREVGDGIGTSWTLIDLGRVAWMRGAPDLAYPRLAEGFTILKELGNPPFSARCLALTGPILLADGAPALGVRLMAAGEALNPLLSTFMTPNERAEIEAARVAALAILGEAAYSENCTAGQRLGLDRALAEGVAGLEALLASPRGTGENSAP